MARSSHWKGVENEVASFFKALEFGVPEDKKKSHRVVGSGAYGGKNVNFDNFTELDGDVIGKLNYLPWPFFVEVKYGYTRKVKKPNPKGKFDVKVLKSGKKKKKKLKQVATKILSLDKRWLDETKADADKKGMLGMVIIRYRGEQENPYWCIIPKDHFAGLMELISSRWEELRAKSKGKQLSLRDISNNDLIEEIRRRVKDE